MAHNWPTITATGLTACGVDGEGGRTMAPNADTHLTTPPEGDRERIRI